MTDVPVVEEPPKKSAPQPLDHIAIVLSVAAALLLVGGVVFAFATASLRSADTTARFQLLGQVANPFIAVLALGGSAIVVFERRAHQVRQAAGAIALGFGIATSLALVLLALNGILADFTQGTTALFRLSTVISRLATVTLAAWTLWLGATAPRAP